MKGGNEHKPCVPVPRYLLMLFCFGCQLKNVLFMNKAVVMWWFGLVTTILLFLVDHPLLKTLCLLVILHIKRCSRSSARIIIGT